MGFCITGGRQGVVMPRRGRLVASPMASWMVGLVIDWVGDVMACPMSNWVVGAMSGAMVGAMVGVMVGLAMNVMGGSMISQGLSGGGGVLGNAK